MLTYRWQHHPDYPVLQHPNFRLDFCYFLEQHFPGKYTNLREDSKKKRRTRGGKKKNKNKGKGKVTDELKGGDMGGSPREAADDDDLDRMALD